MEPSPEPAEPGKLPRLKKLAVTAVTVSIALAVAAGFLYVTVRDDGSSPAPSTTPASIQGALVESPSLFALKMADATNGWALSAVRPGNFIVVRTGDGGRSWRDASPLQGESRDVNAAFFLDRDHAWALVVQRAAQTAEAQARIDWTQDGGRSWREGPVLGGPYPSGQIVFADAQHGWFAQHRGGSNITMDVALFRTADSGLTWRQMSATIDDDRAAETEQLPASCIKTFLVLDRARGFASGSCQGRLPFLFRTEDGGATWRRQLLPAAGQDGPNAGPCFCGIGGPVFPTANDGFLVVTGDVRMVYATHDGGLTWQPTSYPLDTNAGGIEFVDPLHGWLRDGRALYGTANGGATWTLFSQVLDGGPLSFISSSEGWAWLRQGWEETGPPALIHTADGGKTWKPVVP